MKNVTLIIPAYNEEDTIGLTIAEYSNLFPQLEVCIIDNNSRDNTREVALQALSKHPGKTIFLSQPLQGKGRAVRKALDVVENQVIVMVDADTTYSARDLEAMVAPILDGTADMVVGDRISSGIYGKENKRPFHSFGNKLVCTIVNFLFRSNVRDVMSGYRAMSHRFVSSFPAMSPGFELETELTMHALFHDYHIKEIPISYNDRPDGSNSKLNTYSDGFKILKTIGWIFKDYQPHLFFGFISLVIFLAGLACGYPVIEEFIRTEKVLHIPLAILASALMIISFLSFCIGIILHTVTKVEKAHAFLLTRGRSRSQVGQ